MKPFFGHTLGDQIQMEFRSENFFGLHLSLNTRPNSKASAYESSLRQKVLIYHRNAPVSGGKKVLEVAKQHST